MCISYDMFNSRQVYHFLRAGRGRRVVGTVREFLPALVREGADAAHVCHAARAFHVVLCFRKRVGGRQDCGGQGGGRRRREDGGSDARRKRKLWEKEVGRTTRDAPYKASRPSAACTAARGPKQRKHRGGGRRSGAGRGAWHANEHTPVPVYSSGLRTHLRQFSNSSLTESWVLQPSTPSSFPWHL